MRIACYLLLLTQFSGMYKAVNFHHFRWVDRHSSSTTISVPPPKKVNNITVCDKITSQILY